MPFFILKGYAMDNKKLNMSLDDEEYERQLYEQQKKEAELSQLSYEEQQKKLAADAKEAEKERQRKLQQERLELLKLKSGVIEEDNSEIVQEKPQEIQKPATAAKKLENFWYHYKWIVIIAVFFVLVFGFITYDTVTRDKPDMTILYLCDNGGTLRNLEIQQWFEKFTDDFNGDGEIHVSVIDIPLNPDSTDYNTQTVTQSKLMTQWQSGSGVMVIADTRSETEVQYDKTLTDMTALFPDSEVAITKGYPLTSEKLKTDWNWELMPEDMYIGMRTPVKTMVDDEETMQKNFDKSLIVLQRIVEYLEAGS